MTGTLWSCSGAQSYYFFVGVHSLLALGGQELMPSALIMSLTFARVCRMKGIDQTFKFLRFTVDQIFVW
jgi:hypothetical protein